MNSVKKVLLDIKEDLVFLKKKYNVNLIQAILSNRGFHALLFYRIANFLWKNKIPLVPLILTRIMQILYSIDIDYRANIEGGVIIIHGIGTVIGMKVKIGKGTIIYHQVTLGIKMSGKNDGFPRIGKNCVLGAGAKILGNVEIGNNTIIGANTVITFNVSENSIVKFSKKALEIKIKRE